MGIWKRKGILTAKGLVVTTLPPKWLFNISFHVFVFMLGGLFNFLQTPELILNTSNAVGRTLAKCPKTCFKHYLEHIKRQNLWAEQIIPPMLRYPPFKLKLPGSLWSTGSAMSGNHPGTFTNFYLYRDFLLLVSVSFPQLLGEAPLLPLRRGSTIHCKFSLLSIILGANCTSTTVLLMANGRLRNFVMFFWLLTSYLSPCLFVISFCLL